MPLNAHTRLILTNAIYFKARWSQEFDKSATKDAPFHTSATTQVVVPTMHQTRQFRYYSTDSLQVLELRYGIFGSKSMLILLPEDIDGLSNLEELPD